MSDPFERVKGGRLTFKDGSVATRSKTIDKKKMKKKKKQHSDTNDDGPDPTEPSELDLAGDDAIAASAESAASADGGGPETYTIDAAKRMKYEQLFPVEAKKFGYVPKSTGYNSVEDILDDRVKKKADRYCK